MRETIEIELPLRNKLRIDTFFNRMGVSTESGILTMVNERVNRQAKGYLVTDLIDVVCDVMGIEREQVISVCRVRKLVDARSIIFYLARTQKGVTFSEIGDHFNKDHATVVHGVKRAKDLIEYDAGFRDWFLECQKIAKARGIIL